MDLRSPWAPSDAVFRPEINDRGYPVGQIGDSPYYYDLSTGTRADPPKDIGLGSEYYSGAYSGVTGSFYADPNEAAGQRWNVIPGSNAGDKVQVLYNPFESTAAQRQWYYDNATQTIAGQKKFEPGPGGGVTEITPDTTLTISEWHRYNAERDSYYESIHPSGPSIGKDGYTIGDFVDDMKTDRRAGEIQDAEVRKIIGRRQDPQIAINRDRDRNERLKRGQAGYTDDVGRSRRRRTLAALGTRKSPAGSGVLGGGGQPGQAVRPGRTSAASVLG